MHLTPAAIARRTAGDRVGMDRDIGPPVGGRLDRGAQFGFGELQGFDRVVLRTDAAARHELDLAGAISQLLAGAQANFVGTVGYRRHALALGVAEGAARLPRQLEEEAEIAVA